jgi:putative ABC transport system permease protein
VPALTPAQSGSARLRVDAIAADLHATSVLPLRAATDPNGPTGPQGTDGRETARLGKPHQVVIDGRSGTNYNGAEDVPLFVATPELLRHYGIDPAGIDAATDIVTSRTDLDGYDLIGVAGAPRAGRRNNPGRGEAPPPCRPTPPCRGLWSPRTPWRRCT